MSEGLKQATVTTKLVLALVTGALIAGLGTAVYFLDVSNDKLEQEAKELRLLRSNLVTEVEKSEAENIRLKTEALENNVFLGNP